MDDSQLSKKPGFKSPGWQATPYVVVSIILENMAFLSLGINLFPFIFNTMHFSITDSANAVTNFMGTSFLLPLVGGFVSDMWLSRYSTIIIGAGIEFLGFVLLLLSACISSLRPSPCSMLSPTCEKADVTQQAVMFLGLYMVAVGTGACKGNLTPLGADQFNTSDPQEKKELSTYFNVAFLGIVTGALIAVTVLVYIQDNVSRQAGYAIAVASVLGCLVVSMTGHRWYRSTSRLRSPVISIAQVCVAATTKWRLPLPPSKDMLYELYDKEAGNEWHIAHTDQFRFLDKAAIVQEADAESAWSLCTVTQVEEVKIILRIIPVFASTMLMNCVLAQLQTFSVAQGRSLDRHIGSGFEIPPASLASFPFILIIILLPLYDRLFVPLARRITGHQNGITHLQRISIGLLLTILSMVVAALVEIKRVNTAKAYGFLDNPTAVLPMKVYWVALQYLTFGLADMFAFVGMMEFFYNEAPVNMRSMSVSLAWVSTSMGYFISSLLVAMVNSITTKNGNIGWLPNNLNRGKLSNFYWLLAIMSGVNFLNFLFWAWWYKYREILPANPSEISRDAKSIQGYNILTRTESTRTNDQ